MIIQFVPDGGRAFHQMVPQWTPAGQPEFEGQTQLDWTLAVVDHAYQYFKDDYKRLFYQPVATELFRSNFGQGGAPLGPQAFNNPQTTYYPDLYNYGPHNCG